METERKIVVLDDDPTGIQTLHNCELLTCWTDEYLAAALADTSPLTYILTNTRARDADVASAVVSDIVGSVLRLNRSIGRPLTFLCRSDSTLRSHFPLEAETVMAGLSAEGAVTDAVFLAPAFFEGGRVTLSDTHYLQDERGALTKTSDTEFARDAVFGYRDSYLPAYIQEKTKGRVRAEQTCSVPRALLSPGRENELDRLLQDLDHGVFVVVNAADYQELRGFAEAAHRGMDAGKGFVFQSGASLVKALGRFGDRALLRAEIVRPGGNGMIVIGSHVQQTTAQLERLLTHDRVEGVEVDVGAVLERPDAMRGLLLAEAERVLRRGATPALYTSRDERLFGDRRARLEAGQAISRFLARLVRETPFDVDWVIAKGGITAHEVLSAGLEARRAHILGQVAPGVPVVRTPSESARGEIVYVIFPGNVGGPEALRDTFEILLGEQP